MLQCARLCIATYVEHCSMAGRGSLAARSSERGGLRRRATLAEAESCCSGAAVRISHAGLLYSSRPLLQQALLAAPPKGSVATSRQPAGRDVRAALCSRCREHWTSLKHPQATVEAFRTVFCSPALDLAAWRARFIETAQPCRRWAVGASAWWRQGTAGRRPLLPRCAGRTQLTAAARACMPTR